MTTYQSVFGDEAVPQSDSSFVAVYLSSDTVFYWPELSSGTNLTADIMEVSSSGAYSILMPPANQVSVGREVLVRNVSSFLVTIKGNTGTVIGTVDAGAAKLIYITDNSSVAGSWSILALGTGVSSSDAAALAGRGLKAISTTLNQESKIISSSSNSTISSSSLAGTVVYSSSGAVTCSLLDTNVASNGFFFHISNQGSGGVTIDPFASQLVDGETSKYLSPGESATLVCSGTEWVTIGHGRSTQFQFTKLILDVSSGSPFTLSSYQAQNKLIEFIGTLSAPAIVNIPAVVAVYYTQCSYSGSFDLTVKTATGVGVDLQPNERSILYCDGVNVVLAQTATSPVVNIDGGVAGAIPYQAAEDITEFSSAGNSGDLFRSGGTSTPTWMDPNEFLTLKTGQSGSTILAVGTEIERDVSPQFGMLRGNQDTGSLEYFTGTAWGAINGSAVMNEESFTATEGQTIFVTVAPYTVGLDALSIFINGLEQASTAYTETDNHTVTFSEGLSAGDHVEMRWGTAEFLSETDASLVSYLPAGTGAVATNVQSKLRESVSVKDFGAVGDGVTNDTAAFQAATTYSPAQAVFVPARNYVISGTVTGKFYSLGAVTILGGVVTTITNLVP